MSDEIKEMNFSEMLFNRDERLLDYITNLQIIEREYSSLLSENAELQQENDRLNEENKKFNKLIETLNKENHRLNEYNHLQSKIDKANQYLEERFIFDDENGEYYQTHTFDKSNAKELHDILKVE